MSFLIIVISEIGDKTFFIAAIMSMKHPRLQIFSAAISALLVMTVLSAYLGHVVPNLISKKHTQLLAALLFFVFGVRMIWDARGMTGEEGKEELEEVQMELEGEEAKKRDEEMELGEVENPTTARRSGEATRRSGETNRDADDTVGDSGHASGDGGDVAGEEDKAALIEKKQRKAGKGNSRDMREGCMNLAYLLFSPVWIQAFVLTFLAEWGDRSQIASEYLLRTQVSIFIDGLFTTITLLTHHIFSPAVAMAGAEDFWWVTFGSIAGHAVCSCVAVMGGRLVRLFFSPSFSSIPLTCKRLTSTFISSLIVGTAYQCQDGHLRRRSPVFSVCCY